MLAVTSLYASLLAALFIALSVRVIRYRQARKLSLGDEGDRGLLKRMRAQANCAEYAPFGVILLALIEAGGAAALVVHALGLLLLAGRAGHAWGFSASPPVMAGRVGGMVATLTMIALSALWLLVSAVI